MRQTMYAVSLPEAERARLRTLIGRGEAPARMLTRARILLKANQGEGGPCLSDETMAGALEVRPATVARFRLQCVELGMDAALERKGCRRASSMARMVALACSGPPTGRPDCLPRDKRQRDVENPSAAPSPQ